MTPTTTEYATECNNRLEQMPLPSLPSLPSSFSCQHSGNKMAQNGLNNPMLNRTYDSPNNPKPGHAECRIQRSKECCTDDDTNVVSGHSRGVPSSNDVRSFFPACCSSSFRTHFGEEEVGSKGSLLDGSGNDDDFKQGDDMINYAKTL